MTARKRDHIELAFKAQLDARELDDRFYYEPMLAAHPESSSLGPIEFVGKKMSAPIWVSSMTGGTEWAHTINHNLARACREFGLGMGLGSCRSLLEDDTHLADFNVRDVIGDELLLFANLGIAQLESIIHQGKIVLLNNLIDKLKADGLIIHVNPLQEWIQPEGDRIQHLPIKTITELLERFDFPVIVKEVGQGFGPESMRALLQLPLAAIDFAASGGTNFSKLESLRTNSEQQVLLSPLIRVGHSAIDMVEMCNTLVGELGGQLACQQLIISGGINDFLDGYYLTKKSILPAIYGQASSFLEYARGDYSALQGFVKGQIKGLELANAFLRLRV